MTTIYDIDAMKQRIAKLEADNNYSFKYINDDVEQFNAGYTAGQNGEPCEPPHYDDDHDVWVLGWKAGRFDKVQEEHGKMWAALSALSANGVGYAYEFLSKLERTQ